MIAFIDDHREAHGVEQICKVLPIAPSTYHDHFAKRIDFSRLSARARRDAALKDEVRHMFEANFRVCGVRKVWRQLQREGFEVARCTVARLMKPMGLETWAGFVYVAFVIDAYARRIVGSRVYANPGSGITKAQVHLANPRKLVRQTEPPLFGSPCAVRLFCMVPTQ